MTRPDKFIAATVFVAALGTLASAAQARDPDMAALQKVPVTLVQAIAAAEQHAKGRAIEADLEEGWSGATYDVKVITPTARVKVVVDATSGAVLSAQEKAPKTDDD